ncbi:hypothetical protein ACFW04_013987 [Cataglyphis niger]
MQICNIQSIRDLTYRSFWPVTTNRRQFKHALVIVDSFTRFTWLFPMKSTGTTFASNEFAHFLASLQIKHQVDVAAPWANDLKKKLNKTQYVINNTRHSAIKCTPSKLFLGYDYRNNSDKNLLELIRQHTNMDESLS